MGKARFAIGEISGQRGWSGATYQWERGDVRRGGTTKEKKVTLSLFLVVEEIEIGVVLLVVGDVPVVNKVSMVTLSIS